jgi:hypothetical protein
LSQASAALIRAGISSLGERAIEDIRVGPCRIVCLFDAIGNAVVIGIGGVVAGIASVRNAVGVSVRPL